MRKISGVTTFIGCSIGCLGSLYGIFEAFNRWREYDSASAFNEMLLILLLVIAFSLGIYYTVTTKFGFTKPTVLENLERENEIIRKQIEKKELLLKLENLEKKQ